MTAEEHKTVAACSRPHDRIGAGGFEATSELFRHFEPKPLATVDVLGGGKPALVAANASLGLALSDDEVDYLVDIHDRRPHPTDVELMMFAQANSGALPPQDFQRLLGGGRRGEGQDPLRHDPRDPPGPPQGTVVMAYADNASIIEGAEIARFYPEPDGTYGYKPELTHIPTKVETHNHPTAISPFPGASTGSGGEIRDGAPPAAVQPKAGLCGFSVSNLNLPDAPSLGKRPTAGRRASLPPSDIMLEGPIGAAAFNNEFGRPNLTGYFRTLRAGRGRRKFRTRLPQADRDRRRPGQHPGRAVLQSAPTFPVGTLFVQLGGPGMLIGLGGGAASSMTAGVNAEDLDFASVQRGNPEIQRRAQEVIDRCWQLGSPGATGRRRATATPSCRSTTSAPAAFPTPCPNWPIPAASAPSSTCARCPSRSRACRRPKSGPTNPRSATSWPFRPAA